MSGIRRLLGIGTLLFLTGCGGQGVRVAYEIAPPPAPGATSGLPTPVATPALPTRAPPPTVPPTRRPIPTPAPAPSEDPLLTPRPPEPVPVRVRVESSAPYEVLIRLRDDQGRLMAEDQVSENGLGVKRNLEPVAPGRYRLQLLAWPLLEHYPLYDRVVELNPEFPPVFHFALFGISIPEEGRFLLEEGLEFELREEPSRAPVHRGKLSDIAMRTTFGDHLRGQMILPFGRYTMVMTDPDPKDDAQLLADDGLPMVRSDPVSFELTETKPSVVLDLSAVLGVKGMVRKRDRTRRPGG